MLYVVMVIVKNMLILFASCLTVDLVEANPFGCAMCMCEMLTWQTVNATRCSSQTDSHALL